VGAVDRGLFWGGALAPGHAVKWHVAAPGNEVRFDTSVSGVSPGGNWLSGRATNTRSIGVSVGPGQTAFTLIFSRA